MFDPVLFAALMGSTALFSPTSLFSAGEQGAWYDPSDFSTMFQDSAGTTPVTAVEQPVGLILDKSKGLAIGSELVTNGDFSSGTTGWAGSGTYAVSGGALVFTDGVYSEIYQTPGSAITNKYIKVSFNLTITSGTVTFRPNYFSTAGQQAFTTSGLKEFYVFGDGTRFAFITSATPSGASIDNVSIKAVAGNHASQSTSASRPVLSARVNLLTYSEQFDNAAWTRATGVAISANAGAAPDGSNTADKLYASSSGSNRFLYQTLTLASGLYRWSLRAKAVEKSIVYIDLTGAGTTQVFFNLASGAVGSVASGYTAAITSLGNGWYECSVTNNSSATYSFGGVYGVADANGSTAVTANGTDGVYIWGADLRVTNDGVGIPAYQRVGAAVTATTNPAVTGVPDYDTTGYPFFLRFDGTDDSLATATISPGGDKLQVFAGVRKIAGTGFQAAVGYGFTTAGSFYLYAPTPVKADYGFYATGNIGTNTKFTDATFTPPISSVVSSFVDGALAQATQVTGRVNGSSAALSAGGAMTLTSIGADKIYLGRRQNSDLPFNGNLYSIIFRFGANLSDAQIASTETYVNNLTKAY